MKNKCFSKICPYFQTAKVLPDCALWFFSLLVSRNVIQLLNARHIKEETKILNKL